MWSFIVFGFIIAVTTQNGKSVFSLELEGELRLEREVRDFEEFLRQRTKLSSDSEGKFHLSDGDANFHRRDSRDFVSDHNGKDKPVSSNFESQLQDFAYNNAEAKKDDLPPESEILSIKIPPNRGESAAAAGHPKVREESTAAAKPHKVREVSTAAAGHHKVEEILFIRRSDSDKNDPIAEVIDKIFHQRREESSVLDAEEPVAAEDQVEVFSTKDTCQSDDLTSNRQNTCSDGPEYEVKFHPSFPETLRKDMKNMLPDPDEKVSKCDYLSDLGPEKGVEDRALCPYKLKIVNSTSRIPEYLYEAECSCQVSREFYHEGKFQSFECVKVKRVIPVLLATGCDKNGEKIYKQGWEEIAVACAPLIEYQSGAKESDGVQ